MSATEGCTGRGPGRPSAFTPDVRRRLLEAALAGLSARAMARVARVDTSTLRRWLGDPRHVQFRVALERAAARHRAAAEADRVWRLLQVDPFYLVAPFLDEVPAAFTAAHAAFRSRAAAFERDERERLLRLARLPPDRVDGRDDSAAGGNFARSGGSDWDTQGPGNTTGAAREILGSDGS